MRIPITIFSVFLFLILANGCQRSTLPLAQNVKEKVQTKQFSTGADLIGLASPIQLYKGENLIQLEDYFLEAKIDSVRSDGQLPFVLDKQKKEVKLNILQIGTPLSNLSFYSGDKQYDILVKSPSRKDVSLILKDNDYKQVQIKGEMNAWNPAATLVTLEGGEWVTRLSLNSGNYQYKYIVDGNEMNDPHNDKEVSNGIGGTNSVLVIPKPLESALTKLSTASYDGELIYLDYTSLPTDVFAYWNNTRIPYKIVSSQIQLTIPEEAAGLERSHIRVWSYNSEGLSNDILIPLSGQAVLDNPSQITRSDKEAQIMYFVLVDRFNNGDTGNDDPIDDERLKPLTNYEGGDLEGITQKIQTGYFDSLNINSLWISPITQNPLEAYQEYIEPQYFYSGYHGYWPISSSKVDHRFGTDADMTSMVEMAHENGINVLLDYVTNHVHEEHPLYKNHPEYATDLILPDGSKNLRIWDEQRLTTWFDEFMPSLDLSIPEVRELQVDSTMYWLQKFKLDGYRHDATKHIPLSFWKRLTRKLKEEVVAVDGRSIYQIGETYGSRDLIQSYISSGMLDSQFDFNLYFVSREVFANQGVSFEKIVTSLKETFSYYGHHSSMGYISGNHDQVRFISLASGDVRFDEDGKMAGFNREIGTPNALGYARMELLMAFIMSIPGVPVIYYGDEIGMPGAGDPDSRRMMRFENLSVMEGDLLDSVKKLTGLRKNNLAMIYGDTNIVAYDVDYLVLHRQYFDNEVYVLMNISEENKTMIIPADLTNWSSLYPTDIISGASSKVAVDSWGYAVIYK